MVLCSLYQLTAPAAKKKTQSFLDFHSSLSPTKSASLYPRISPSSILSPLRNIIRHLTFLERKLKTWLSAVQYTFTGFSKHRKSNKTTYEMYERVIFLIYSRPKKLSVRYTLHLIQLYISFRLRQLFQQCAGWYRDRSWPTRLHLKITAKFV